MYRSIAQSCLKSQQQCKHWTFSSCWPAFKIRFVNQGCVKSRTRKMADPAVSNTASTIKQMRSMTAAAIIHSLVICWSMSIWRRSRASMCCLLSSRSWIEANRRSTELLLCAVDTDAPADDDDVISGSRLTSFDTSISSRPLLLSQPLDEVIFVQTTDASFSHTSFLNYGNT